MTKVNSEIPVIECRSVYKIFGPNTNRLMKEANDNIEIGRAHV